MISYNSRRTRARSFPTILSTISASDSVPVLLFGVNLVGSGGKGVDEEAVRWLLSRGASTTTRDSTGATAADCASAMGNRRIEALLSEGRSHSDKATKAPKGGTVSAKPSTGRVSTNSLPVPSGAWGDDGAGRRGGSSAPQTSNACALL